jgi:hypothetical protein
VFGIELLGVGQIVIGADDGSTPFVMLPVPIDTGGTWREPQDEPHVHTNGRASQPEIPLTETAPGKRNKSLTVPGPHASGEILSGEIGAKATAKTQRHASVPPVDVTEPGKRDTTRDSSSNTALAGEIVARPTLPLPNPPTLPPHGSKPPIEMPRSADEITQPGVPTPVPGSLTLRGIPTAEPKEATKPEPPPVPPPAGATNAPKARSSSPSIPPPIPAAALRHTPPPQLVTASPLSTLSGMGSGSAGAPASSNDEARGSIIGIGMSAIGSTGAVAGEIPTKVPPGGRVLVPGPNGLMQSATVRQLLQGYYELEVGSSGETIWVPISGVVPE